MVYQRAKILASLELKNGEEVDTSVQSVLDNPEYREAFERIQEDME